MPLAAQQFDDALFVQRRQLGEHRGARRRLRQLLVVHLFDLAAAQQTIGFQPDVPAHFGGHQLVVAGEDFHRDAVLFQRRQRRRGAFLRRIEEGDVAFEDQIRLIRHAVFMGLRRQDLVGHRHHPQPLLVEIVGDAANARQQRLAQRDHLVFVAHVAANRQHLFQRALAHQLVILVVLGHHHRHAAAYEIERDLIHLAVVLQRRRLPILLRAAQHRHVEQVFQPGLVEAVQPGVAQHPLAASAERIGVALQHDLVLSQGAGLVGAQNVHGAEVLDGVQAFDDHLLARQLHRPFGQRRGDDHRQHFRRQPDRHRQREQRRFPPVALGVAVDQQHDRRHHQHKADQQPADLADAALEGVRLLLLAGDALRQLAEIGAAAGADHHRQRGAADHVGAHEAQVLAVERIGRQRLRRRGFFHRQRFTGQRRLTDEQILGRQQAQIRRDHVAGRQLDDIARHQLRDRQLHVFALAGERIAADHRGGVAHHRFQRIGRPVGARLLDEVQQRGDQHHQRDHQRAGEILGGVRDHAERGQQQVERVAVAVPEVLPPGLFLLIVDDVLAAAPAHLLRLMGGDAFRVAVETLKQLHRLCGGAFQPLLRQAGRHIVRSAADAVQQAVAAHQTARKAAGEQAQQLTGEFFQFHGSHLVARCLTAAGKRGSSSAGRMAGAPKSLCQRRSLFFFQQQVRTTKRAPPVTVMYFTGKTAAPGGKVLPVNRVSV